jgi:hypothetical protein
MVIRQSPTPSAPWAEPRRSQRQKRCGWLGHRDQLAADLITGDGTGMDVDIIPIGQQIEFLRRRQRQPCPATGYSNGLHRENNHLLTI